MATRENEPPKSSLLQGTLDLLILRILAMETMHGWGISERIQWLSGEVFEVNQGSLYPALQRLKRQGWVSAQWRISEKQRRARYYTLTDKGHEQLGLELEQWRQASVAVNRIIEATA